MYRWRQGNSVFADFDDVWPEQPHPRLSRQVLADFRPTDNDAKISGLGHAYVSVLANEGIRSLLTLTICAISFLSLSVWLTTHIVATGRLLFVIPLLPSVGVFVLCSGYVLVKYRYRRLVVETVIFCCALPLITMSKAFRMLTAGVPPTKMGPSDSVALGRKWIETCSRQHHVCRYPLGPTTFITPRLLEINTADEHSHQTDMAVRLVETNLSEHIPSYIALAVRGEFENPIKLTKENMDKLQEEVRLGSLPQVWQDAISVTSRLGYRYLWIDQLCILQEPESDWLSEVTQAGLVFANAACTIFTEVDTGRAGSFSQFPVQEISKKSPENFSKERIHEKSKTLSIATCSSVSTLSDLPSRLSANNSSAIPGEVPIDTVFEQHGVGDFGSQTPWTFQANLLSLRSLHFCKDGILLFECSTMRASKQHQDGVHHFPEMAPTSPVTAPSPAKLRHSFTSPHHSLNMSYYYRTREKLVDPLRNVYKFETLVLPSPPPSSQPMELNEAVIQRQIEGLSNLSSVTRLRGALHRLLRAELPKQVDTNESQDKLELHHAWMDIVEAYSGCRFPENREKCEMLLPLLGISSVLSEHLTVMGSPRKGWSLVGGLWMDLLPLNLLWFRVNVSDGKKRDLAGEQVQTRPSGIPTWSWASIEGKASYRRIGQETTPRDQAVETNKKRRKSRLVCVPQPGSELLRTRRYRNDWVKVDMLLRGEIELEQSIVNAKLKVQPTWEMFKVDELGEDGGEVDLIYDFDVSTWTRPKGLLGLPLVKLRATNNPAQTARDGLILDLEAGVRRRGEGTEIHGILVKKVDDGENTYERVGYFWTGNTAAVGRMSRISDPVGGSILLK
ncbi:hypothetical protein QBC44DRAFT_313984 [Cladorrhinum sp. PSN332]|nr:hypothetical protein QBC44DRAFT_313984 [Cladorrhinum sp. PSN332]